ncbi:hypothetical protein ACJX0J_039476, partial [Zea mays]
YTCAVCDLALDVKILFELGQQRSCLFFITSNAEQVLHEEHIHKGTYKNLLLLSLFLGTININFFREWYTIPLKQTAKFSDKYNFKYYNFLNINNTLYINDVEILGAKTCTMIVGVISSSFGKKPLFTKIFC